MVEEGWEYMLCLWQLGSFNWFPWEHFVTATRSDNVLHVGWEVLPEDGRSRTKRVGYQQEGWYKRVCILRWLFDVMYQLRLLTYFRLDLVRITWKIPYFTYRSRRLLTVLLVLRTADIMRNIMKVLAFRILSYSSFTISQAAESCIIWLMKLISFIDTVIY
jgi:hypothetical protein